MSLFQTLLKNGALIYGSMQLKNVLHSDLSYFRRTTVEVNKYASLMEKCATTNANSLSKIQNYSEINDLHKGVFFAASCMQH